MVVICLPATALTGTEQDRIATPSTWTVQAPHWAMPQPYLVPVRPTLSRNAQSSGVSGSTSMLWDWPLIVRVGIPQSSRSDALGLYWIADWMTYARPMAFQAIVLRGFSSLADLHAV